MPSLTRAALFAILATFCFYAASDNGTRMPGWVRSSLVIAAVILAACAIVDGINWLSYNLTARVEHLRRVQNMTPTLDALRVMASLSPAAQVELALHFGLLGVSYPAILSERGPLFYLPLRGYRIGYEFIDEFMQRSDDRYLCPVGTWGEGSNERNWAVALTSFLVERGYATAYAGGPKPAAWRWFDSGRVSGYNRASIALFGETPPLLEDE